MDVAVNKPFLGRDRSNVKNGVGWVVDTKKCYKNGDRENSE